MAEARALEILREELEKSPDGSARVNHLSIKTKWGQGELDLGPLPAFLEKNSQEFDFDGSNVRLRIVKGKGKGGLDHDGSDLKAAAKGGAKGNGKGFEDDGFKGAPGFGKDGKGFGKDAKGGFDGKGCGKDFSKGDKGGKGFASDMAPEDRKRFIEEDSLPAGQAKAAIEHFKTSGVELELGMLSKRLAPDDEVQNNAKRCLEIVRSAVTGRWGQGSDSPSVDMCGSYAQGTQIKGAALDLAFRIPSSYGDYDRGECVRELRNQLSQQSHQLQAYDTMGSFPHSQSPMAIELRGTGLFAHVLVEELRVNRPPTLDEVIRQLCDTFRESYALVRLVKVWSTNHGLANPQDGFINGVAWTLLVLFFLQKQKLVPPYSVIASGQHINPSPSPMPVSNLLQMFFEFLVNQGSAPRGISLFQGEGFSGPPAVFIEDPAHFNETKQQKSLCESLGEGQWNRIMDESKKAFSRIKVRPGRWFHWAEVFDPTDKKPEKIHGLAHHLTLPLSSESNQSIPSGKGFDGKGKDNGKGFDGKGKGDIKGDGKGVGKDGMGKDGGKDFGNDSGKGKDAGKGKEKGFGKDEGKGKDKGWGKEDGKGFGKGFKDGKGFKPY